MGALLPLAGNGVLVTRPAHQADRLCRLLHEQGAQAYRFPTLAIVPLNDDSHFRNAVSALPDCQWAVFVSANAVHYSLRTLQLPRHLKLAAIGKATAMALRQAGYPVHLTPQSRFDSVGLLETPEWKNLSGQTVVVFRGTGGKETLATGLRARGARVIYAECYQRVRAPSSPHKLAEWIGQNRLQAITVTSRATAENLLDLTPPDVKHRLLEVPLVALAPELAEFAVALGFRGPVRAAPESSDTGLIRALLTLHGSG